MRKKVLAAVFPLLCIFLCAIVPNAIEKSDAYDKIHIMEDSSGILDSYSEELRILFLSDAPMHSWKSAEEIPPRQLMLFYCAANGLYPKDDMKAETVPAEKVEKLLKKHFDISIGQLRESDYYDEQTESYTMKFPLRPSVDINILSAAKAKDRILISYEYLDKDKTQLMTGSMQFTAGFNKIKYLSCKAHLTYLDVPPEKGALRFVFTVENMPDPLWIEYKPVAGLEYSKDELDKLAAENLEYILMSKLKKIVDINDYKYSYRVEIGE